MKRNLLLLPILSIGTIIGMYFWITEAYHSAVLEHNKYVLEKSGVFPLYFDLYSDLQIDSILTKKIGSEKIYWEVYMTGSSKFILKKSALQKKNIAEEPIILLLSKSRIARLFVHEHISGILYFMRYPLLVAFCFAFVYILCILMFIKFYKQHELVVKLKESFIANITHELKTPVTAINAAIELLEDFNVGKSPEKRKFYTYRIKRELMRLLYLIETLTEISLSKEEVDLLKKETVNITQVINTSIDEYYDRIKEKKAVINFVSSSEEILVQGITKYIRNGISVIIDNALKYSNNGVRITIDHIITNKNVIIRISDTGIGIPSEYKSHIFQKFFRDPSNIEKGIKGHGLGLFYARELMRYCNGNIIYQPLQNGSCFSIILPAK